MKIIKKLTLSEAVESLGEFETKDRGTSTVVYHDAVENMKKARELADERLKEQNKAVEKPVDGTAKGGQTTIKNIPEAKKLHLSESLFEAFEDEDDEVEEPSEDWYDMYAFIMDSFTEGGLDYKMYKIPKAVPKNLSVGCTAPDNADDAINHFPIGVDNDDNIVVNCSSKEILNAYIKCAEDYKLEYKVIDNKKPGAYNNFTIKVAIPKDSIGQVECIGDYFEGKGIALDSVLGSTDNGKKNSFALYLAKKGELFANPDDNEAFVKEHTPARMSRRKKQEVPTEVEREVAIADATETEEPVEESISDSDNYRAARPNSAKLLDMVDGGVVDSVKLADDLIAWLPDDEVGEFARTYEYFSESQEECLTEGAEELDHYEILDWLSEHEQAYEDAESFFSSQGLMLADVPVDDLISWMYEHEQLWDDFRNKFGDPFIESVEQKPVVEGKEVTFTLDGKEYKGICVGDSSTNPDMCDVRIGKEYYDNEENIAARKGIFNPHENREIKDGKFFIPKSELKEAYVKTDLRTFQPWEGAVDTLDMIKDAGKLSSFEAMIDEMYPEGIEKTSLNDLLWFERDWVLDMLQISSDDEETDTTESEE